MSLDKYVSFATKSFALPDICVRIRMVMDDPYYRVEDIGRLIELDPSLSAKVLRLANSSLFRFPSQVDSISKAINVIGGEALYNLVVAETANTAFKHFDGATIKLDKHWHKSVYCGIVAKYLAKSKGLRGTERFFVMGILQNLSELVVANYSPQLYQRYLDDSLGLAPAEKQIKYFGFTFSQCSGTILESWNLPLVLYYPVMHVNDESRMATDPDVALLTLASRIATKQHDNIRCNESELLPNKMANIVNIDAVTSAMSFADQETAKISMLIH